MEPLFDIFVGVCSFGAFEYEGGAAEYPGGPPIGVEGRSILIEVGYPQNVGLCFSCQVMRSKACAQANGDFAGLSSGLETEVYLYPVNLIY